MAALKIKGIVIAEKNFNDFDKIVTILTPNGKIEASARGARRPKSQLMAATQFLCFGDYMLFKGSNIYTLNSCEPLEIFYNIRTDIEKLEYASKITKIILDVTYENQNSYRILQLYLNTLYVISETKINLDFAISIFELRLMSLLGFSPIIDNCVSCKKEEKQNLYFSFKDNGFKCLECAKQDTRLYKNVRRNSKCSKIYYKIASKKNIFI